MTDLAVQRGLAAFLDPSAAWSLSPTVAERQRREKAVDAALLAME
jgi:hypothetical protein